MCSGQILTLVKIVTQVPSHQKHLKRTINSTYRLDHCGSKEKASNLVPSPHSTGDPSLTSTTTRSLSNLRSLYDIRNYQVPLRPHLFGIVHPDIQLGRNHPTSRKPAAKNLIEDLPLSAGYNSAAGFSDSRSQLCRQIIPTF